MPFVRQYKVSQNKGMADQNVNALLEFYLERR